MRSWTARHRTLAMAGACSLLACTPTLDAAPSAQAEPENSAPRPASAEPLEPTELDPRKVEALALACDGAALARLGVSRLAQLDANSAPTSAGLLATWESARAFTPEGTLDPAAVNGLASALKVALGQAPPQWWLEQLAAAQRRGRTEPPFYDVGLTEHGDRRGAWQVGPGAARVRPAAATPLTEHQGKLGYDFSMGRVELGPLPTEPGTAIEHVRAHAGTTVYYATFSVGAGGFPFPLRAVGSDGVLQWTAEACGPKRQLLGGLGHLTVQLVVLEDPPSGGRKLAAAAPPRGLAVFTAESHGVALEVFDITNGARTLAWSSDLWFARES